MGSDGESNLFTVSKNIKGVGKQERDRLLVAGKYHLDDSVNMFQHGSLLMGMPIVGQSMKSVGELDHRQWRVCLFAEEVHKGYDTSEVKVRAENSEIFLDGDLIERFLELSLDDVDRVSAAMTLTVGGAEKESERYD
ncbi:hypothetical protein POM88_035612 [Heracleum sosnowskyi]|uniref:Uncharacterized protein n=1 Tax=Heracleum sosnowskyi TaxID=360622 RepID=A0AAD8HNU3_9APIA|nr:hypothetical protein POM88_035612 [Heracleum sosnowskyi]